MAESHAPQDAGKIERSFELAKTKRDNRPDAIERALKPALDAGLLTAFPFRTDFTEIERRLLPALQTLKFPLQRELVALLLRGLSSRSANLACLDRLGLAQPRTPSDWIYAALVRGALNSR